MGHKTLPTQNPLKMWRDSVFIFSNDGITIFQKHAMLDYKDSETGPSLDAHKMVFVERWSWLRGEFE